VGDRPRTGRRGGGGRSGEEGAPTRSPASIKWVALGGHEHFRDLALGERLTFGSCACGTWELAMESERYGHVAGAIMPCADHWRVDNLSRATPLLVEDLEDPQQFIRVPGMRCGAVIPFELARISVAGPDSSPILTVFGPEPAVRPDAVHRCTGKAGENAAHLALDRGTRYFAVLRALCESQHSGPGRPVPTSETIARRLAESGVRLTARAVDHHIDYLVRRLGLRPAAGSVQRSWKKEVLVGVALRQGLLDVPA